MQKRLGIENVEQEIPFLQSLSGQITPRVPFWLMRQAGRYLPEYRALRAKAGSFLGLCFNPALAAEVTLQPLRRFDMDAAILFSDILVVPYALGQALDFVEGEGPRLGPLPKTDEIDFATFDRKLQPVYETIGEVKKNLTAGKGLIGFAGAPWTIACYMMQGQGGGEFVAAKKSAFENPTACDQLIASLVDATSHYLIGQINAGADAVQIFDSWAGLLPEPYFNRWVISPTKKIIENIHKTYPEFPIIGFPRGAGAFYKSYAEKTSVTGLGIDQYYPLEKVANEIGSKIVLQGNMDPAFLLTGGSTMESEAKRILTAMVGKPFIFNLGHGVIKETPPEHVAQLAEIIRDHKR
jgi:uroporphyrinogen decarboxylase